MVMKSAFARLQSYIGNLILRSGDFAASRRMAG
jgi:hypothetical protein